MSGLQSKLRTGTPGHVALWSQRELEPAPWLNCRFYSFLTTAWWAGLRWEGGRTTARQLAEHLRRASGRPEIGPSGQLQGSSAADLDRAIGRILPWLRIRHMRIGTNDLLRHLGDRYVATVPVWLPLLPARQQRFSGSGAVGHQVGLVGARGREVRYLDPLGPWGYNGDWVRLSAITPAIRRYGWPPFASIMERGDAMLTTVTPAHVYVPGTATAKVAKGTWQTYRLRANDFQRAVPVRVKADEVADVAYVALVDKLPHASLPQGRFALITSGSLDGRFVRAADVTIQQAAGGDTTAAYHRGVTDGRAAEAALYQAVDDTVYTREDA